MGELIVPLWGLAALFFIVAFTYSTVGLGGGSSYTALMAIAGMNIIAIPLISLTLNLIVTSFGTYHFVRNRHLNVRLLLPFLVSSMPMAYLGGSLHLDKQVFEFILLVSLIFVAARIYLWDQVSFNIHASNAQKIIISLVSGAVLGLIAGIAGIGGGIYLVPLILVLNLGTLKQAAACGVIFIFLNSFMGLAGRLAHHSVSLVDYWPLIFAVFIGGFVGSRLGSTTLNPKTMEKILGGIILIAIVFLGRSLIK